MTGGSPSSRVVATPRWRCSAGPPQQRHRPWRSRQALAERRRHLPTMRLRASVITGNVDQRSDGTYVGPDVEPVWPPARCGPRRPGAHDRCRRGICRPRTAISVSPPSTSVSTGCGASNARYASCSCNEGASRPPSLHCAGASGTIVPLPRRPTNLFGREDDVVRVTGLLHEHQVTSIVGARCGQDADRRSKSVPLRLSSSTRCAGST